MLLQPDGRAVVSVILCSGFMVRGETLTREKETGEDPGSGKDEEEGGEE